MIWMSVLVVSYLWLGLRRRKSRESSTLTMLMITSLVLGFVYQFVLK